MSDLTANISTAAVETNGWSRPEPLPKIDVSGGDLHRMASEALEALVRSNNPTWPRVLVRGNELVRTTERGELEAFVPASLREELTRVANFGKQSKKDNEWSWSSQVPPRDVVDALLARDSAEYGDLPRADRVIDAPVVAADEALVTEPGHHPASRLFYQPADGLGNVAPGSVESLQELLDARDLLLEELLGDFEFVDQASRANALGLLLLPFVRDLIDGPTPMHMILAPEIGTGKTLLAQAALLPSCGEVSLTAGDRDHNDEWRKTLTAALLGGQRAIIFDNLSGTLDSGPLAAALTSGVWRDRVLGHSKEVSLPVRNAWVATGNNLGLSDEQARRAVPIFLDPGEVRPADRPKDKFRHPDLLRWAKQNRTKLARAALTLVQHWLDGASVATPSGAFWREDEGLRHGTERTLGSFEQWSDVVGGILRAADVPGFLDNRDMLATEANSERQEVADFLAAWCALDREPLRANELADLCAYGCALHNDLPTELAAAREDRRKQELGYWLRRNRNRRFDGYQLVKQDGGRSVRNRWLVRKSA